MPRIVPATPEIAIFLAKSFEKQVWEPFEGRALVIAPTGTTWNDFGHNFHAGLNFVGFGESHPRIEMRLMLKDKSGIVSAVQDLVREQPFISLSYVETPFISALVESANYREIIERLGFLEAFTALRQLHDVVVARLEEVDETTLALEKEVSFVEGILRRDSTWDAVRNGGRHLSPIGAMDVEDAAQVFDVEVSLPGLAQALTLEVDFGLETDLSSRVLVLVGENGVGKTRLLNSIISGLQSSPEWDHSVGGDVATFSRAPTFSRLVTFSSVGASPYPLRIAPWRGIDYRFHRMAGQPLGAHDSLSQSLLDCMRTDHEAHGMTTTERVALLKTVLTTLGIGNQLHVEVAAVSSDDANLLPAPVNVDGRGYLPFFGPQGEQRRLQLEASMVRDAPPKVLTGDHRVRSLSSGEDALLRFTAQAIGSLRRGTLFLLDEPETHLHPHFVSVMMSILHRILEASQSVALIATHSAYVVREVPARRVRIARKQSDGSTLIELPRLQTFGASIDTISQFVFGDAGPKHHYQSVIDRWVVKTPNATVAQFRQSFGTDLNPETLSYVAFALNRQATA
jgi:predicted ATPase